jgi:hypothetical protein
MICNSEIQKEVYVELAYEVKHHWRLEHVAVAPVWCQMLCTRFETAKPERYTNGRRVLECAKLCANLLVFSNIKMSVSMCGLENGRNCFL